MLEEINFQWVLQKEVKVTHAHRKRVRNISKAHSAIQLMNEYCCSVQKEISPVKDEQLAKDLARQIAQHFNDNEALKPSSDDVGHAMMTIFRQGFLAGITEVDLFHAFELSDQGNEGYVTSNSTDSMSHPHPPNHHSQGSNSLNECLSDRKGQWTHQRKRIRVDEQSNQTKEEVENRDLNNTMLLSYRFQPEKVRLLLQFSLVLCRVPHTGCLRIVRCGMAEKIFDVWLAERKNIWRQLRKQKHKEVTSIPQIDTEVKKKTALDYRTVGVRQTASMKWVSENSIYPPPPLINCSHRTVHLLLLE
jgi:hypothetical protein